MELNITKQANRTKGFLNGPQWKHNGTKSYLSYLKFPFKHISELLSTME